MKTHSRFRDPQWVRPFGTHLPMVREPLPTDRVLALASHSQKLGGDIQRKWRIPLRIVYLEEYATCPDSCPFKSKLGWRCYCEDLRADRFIVTPLFWELVDRECRHLNIRYREFIVKLHGSGDMPDLAYVSRWVGLAMRYTRMKIWVSTAWARESPIGKALQAAQAQLGPRLVLYFSFDNTHVFERQSLDFENGFPKPHQTANGREFFLCPEQLHRYGLSPKDTPTNCATCRYCPHTGGNLGLLLHADWN